MVDAIKASLSSWQTTTVAILQFLVILFGAVINVMDLDPATIADWNKVIVALVGLLSSIGLFRAQDAGKGK
jgi:hypothetical protein